jgi:hypothetical protein
MGGPITLVLAIDLGPAFAAKSAMFTLAAVVAQSAHLMTLAHVGQRMPWYAALAGGWAAFFTLALATTLLPMSVPLAATLAIAGLFVAGRWLPRVHGESPLPSIPPMELRLRLVAAAALAGLIVWSAPIFGPTVSGVLISLPITGSIMPPFTLALYGPAALARLVRGFVVGLTGFSSFFLVIAATVVPWGIAPAFLLAVAAALAALYTSNRLARRRRV